MKTLNTAVVRVLKRLHYPLDVILTCARWYVAYPLSLRHLEETMAERGVSVDHSTVHRWAIKLLPVLGKAFRRRKRPVGKSWRMDETYIRVRGEWRYLYRAVDKDGNTIDFLLRAHRDKTAARRYFEKSIAQNGVPETVTIDKSGVNLAALDADRETRDLILQSGRLRFELRGLRTIGSLQRFRYRWNLLPSMATSACENSFSSRQSITKR
jgi:putative transposase